MVDVPCATRTYYLGPMYVSNIMACASIPSSSKYTPVFDIRIMVFKLGLSEWSFSCTAC